MAEVHRDPNPKVRIAFDTMEELKKKLEDVKELTEEERHDIAAYFQNDDGVLLFHIVTFIKQYPEEKGFAILVAIVPPNYLNVIVFYLRW